VTTTRLEAFSDGVFAIAITLLVIEIKVPTETRGLARELGKLWPSYLGFVISFLLIGLIWANHHTMFEHIVHADRLLLFLNTLLLMNVAFLPFAAGVLAEAFRTGDGQRTAVVFYGSALVVGGIFFNAIWEYARRGHRLLADTITARQAHTVSRRFLLGPALYLLGVIVGAFQPIAGISLFALLILVYWLPVTAREYD
jgi:uncharacterized membrane protein